MAYRKFGASVVAPSERYVYHKNNFFFWFRRNSSVQVWMGKYCGETVALKMIKQDTPTAVNTSAKLSALQKEAAMLMFVLCILMIATDRSHRKMLSPVVYVHDWRVCSYAS